MVKPAWKIFLPLAFAGFCFFAGAAETFPDYKIGDVATQEVSTPFKLIVLNPDDTKALREKQALRVPAIFRFDPRIAGDTETNFLSALNRKRDEFQDRLESVFNKRSLKPLQIPLPRFQRLTGNFLRQNRNLLLTTNLLEVWALNQSDEPIRTALATKLRAAADRFIRVDALPPDFKPGPQARLISTTNLSEKLTDDFATRQGITTQRSNVLTLAKARADFVKSFPANEKAAGRALALMLRENCVLEFERTQAERAKKTDDLWSDDHYEPGQLILKGGQVVDAKAKAALEQLHEKMKVGRLQQQLASTRIQTQENRWLLAGVAVLSVVLLFVFFLFTKRKRSMTALPVQLAHGNPGDLLIACPSCEEKIVVPLAGIPELASSHAGEQSATLWKQRAVAAEARAEMAAQAARHGVLSQLAKMLKEKFVMKLASHRAELIDTHERAAADVAELEARLREVNAPLQERLTAYQDRIAELEKELTVRGEENQELIKAKILMAKTQSAIEETKSRMEMN